MNVEEEIATLITRMNAVERVVFAPIVTVAEEGSPAAEVSTARQRIYEQTMAQRAKAEAQYKAESPDWDAQVAGATPAGADGPAGDPETIGIGPKGG
jgi:hypothetical protein